MKKQFIFLTIALLTGTYIQSIENTCFQDGDIITINRTIGNIEIEHQIGTRISAHYTEEAHKKFSSPAIKTGALDCAIDYSLGQLNFGGQYACAIMQKAALTDAIDFTHFNLQISDITTPQAFDKYVHNWITTEINKLRVVTRYNVTMLTQALNMVAKEWKKMIALFIMEIQKCGTRTLQSKIATQANQWKSVR